MDIIKAFRQLYKRNHLQNTPYYLYGSGSCSKKIIDFIEREQYTKPRAILDLTPNQELIPDVSHLTSVNCDSQLQSSKVIIGSDGFVAEITQKIIAHSNFEISNILNLREADLMNMTWNDFSEICTLNYPNNPSEKTHQRKDIYYISAISEGLNQQIIDSLINTSSYNIEHNPTYGYVSNSGISQEELSNTQSCVSYIRENNSLKSAVYNTLISIYDEISTQLNSHWQTESIKVKRFNSSDKQVGSEVFHIDGYNDNIFKILIYLTKPNLQSGTTQFIDLNGNINTVEGRPGTFLLFNNSLITHRGIRGNEGTRTILEVTVSKASEKPKARELLRFTSPFCHYRSAPWQRSTYGLAISDRFDADKPGLLCISNESSEFKLNINHKDLLSKLPKKKFDLIYFDETDNLFNSHIEPIRQLLLLLNVDGDLIISSSNFEQTELNLSLNSPAFKLVSSSSLFINQLFPELDLPLNKKVTVKAYKKFKE